MGSVRPEILWSPIHPEKFITWGTEIFLYEIGPIKDPLNRSTSSHIKVSDNTEIHLLATNSTHRYVKCVDIYPQPEQDTLLAIGQANGKVVLSTFGPTNFEAAGREFTPKHARQCNAVAWNPVDSNIIAAGLEKYRADHAVLLWDVFRCPYHLSATNGEVRNDFIKPLTEIGLSETANSLAWINTSCLVVGFNNKCLKIIDRRDSGKTVNTTLTKAVYGVTVDPHNDQIIASFFENQICVWDARNFEKPLSTIMRVKPLSKVSWCPTRQNLLGSLQRDSSVIMLHDVQLTTVGNDEVEPTLLERPIQPCGHNPITSFSWHPSIESRLLTISLSTNITDYFVVERITLNWLPCSHLVWTHGRRTLKLVSDKDPIYSSFSDISVKIKRRALAEYGLKQELWQNGELCEDPSLKNLWYWLYLSRTLVEEGIIKSNGNYHPGVMSVLALDFKNRSEWVNMSWVDLNNQSYVKVYRSEERECALQLCGWRFDKDVQALTSFLERLQVEGEYSRAAAIAVFNLQLRIAISTLKKASTHKQNMSNSMLGIVAMALSGYSDERSSIWREYCVQYKTELSDPYLKAAFAFLTAENENYESVLNENGIAVEDRVAFACMFLSDIKLIDYLTKLNEKLTEDGDLSGMLLTGASSDGVKLLQRYLDITGDVQSVSLLAIRAFPAELQTEQTLQNWIISYQQLLDSKRLWNQRAHLDIAYNTVCEREKPPQQVFISCNFCGKSISAYMQGNRTRGQLPRLGPTNNKVKMSSCPNCRKPLPRCAICLVHMGTPSIVSDQSDNKLNNLSSWFTWCQSCRHGGHAGHISRWFLGHSECPVTGCTCKCFSLDAGCNVHV